MLDRRALLASAARLGLLGAAARTVPPSFLLAQENAPETWGKAHLIARSVRPPDYETPVKLLDTYLTPNEHFYVRSHTPVPPAADPSTWALTVEGEVERPLKLTLDELRSLPRHSVTVTLECAGNGRAFHTPPVAGIQWGKGAVGTARWTGVRMADVLERANLRRTGKVVVMNGGDRPVGTMPDFVRQVPLPKALDRDTLLAYEMNGAPLPQVHGFPLRSIIPGWEGAYAIKWLHELRVADRDFDGFWVATGYRYPVKRVAPGAAVDPKDMAPLTGLVVKSLITTPLDGATLAPGRIAVGGFAWAGEDAIARVDVSTDSGASWAPARLTGDAEKYAWRRWEFSFDASKRESYLISARATDAKGNAQPATAHWNPSGYLWNVPDQIRIEVS